MQVQMDNDGPIPATQSAETVYFSSGDARVTGQALTVGDHSYDLHDIDLVHIRETQDLSRRRTWLLLSIVAGIIWIIIYFLLFYRLEELRILIAVVVPILWLAATMQWSTATNYILVLETRSGPIDAYTSSSGRQVRELYRAVDEAIRQHGEP